MTRRSFVLTEEIYKSLQGRRKIKKCYLCGREFKIGDIVKSITKRRITDKPICEWVCAECSRKYNIW